MSTTHTHLSSKTITKLHVKYDIRLDNYTMYRDFKVTLRFGTKYQCKKKKTIQNAFVTLLIPGEQQRLCVNQIFYPGNQFFFSITNNQGRFTS